MNKIVTVTFHGAALYCSCTGNRISVALKPIVEAMGLNWSGQEQRIKRDPLLSEGVCMTHIPSEGGGLQQTLCLNLELLNGWLFTINSRRIKDDRVRERVQVYQRECYKVLFERFFGQRQTLASPTQKSENTRIRIVTEVRQTFGIRTAVQMWRKLELPIVPAMEEAFKQIELFGRNDNKAA